MVDGKEIYPSEVVMERRSELVVVNLKTRLLGGVKMKQEESKAIKLEERKLNSGLNGGLAMMEDRSSEKAPVDN